jgi:hypothetical protein
MQMVFKKMLIASAAILGLALGAGQASAEPSLAGSAPEAKSGVTLVYHPGGHAHWGGHYGGGRRGYWRGGRWYWGVPFLAAPFAYGYYNEGGSCYWRCRHYHGPAYCRAYASDFCY